MKQSSTQITFQTTGASLLNITGPIKAWLREQNVEQGLLTIFIRHTSASLTIQENADPDVLHDLNSFFRKLVPEIEGLYRHNAEGPDDMPAHIKSALTQTQLTIPVTSSDLDLGIWQGIYIFEHREHAHKRNLSLHLIGQ
ncbi:MAG: YjbQ family protein [Kordiimonadaceae bacterium]|jgi:secondary thiamine-phosphate synthase enzyme|nr:YjbQ family protein [Kordiimonadaceae bacterium]MBT6031941.1 YjbQ family protein [Kordiimonadaceae bacterium]